MGRFDNLYKQLSLNPELADSQEEANRRKKVVDDSMEMAQLGMGGLKDISKGLMNSPVISKLKEVPGDTISEYNKNAWQRELQENLYDKRLDDWSKGGRKGPAPEPGIGTPDAFKPTQMIDPKLLEKARNREIITPSKQKDIDILNKIQEQKINTPLDENTTIIENPLFKALQQRYKGNR